MVGDGESKGGVWSEVDAKEDEYQDEEAEKQRQQPLLLPEEGRTWQWKARVPSRAAAPAAASGGDVDPVVTGVVTAWLPQGFGFVKVDSGRQAGQDVFVHLSNTADGEPLLPGSRVLAEGVYAGSKTLVAAHVVVLALPRLPTDGLPGTVVSWGNNNFGFVDLDEHAVPFEGARGNRVFVSLSATGGKPLCKGMRVLAFGVKDVPKGLKADTVQVVLAPPAATAPPPARRVADGRQQQQAARPRFRQQ